MDVSVVMLTVILSHILIVMYVAASYTTIPCVFFSDLYLLYNQDHMKY